MGSAQVKAHLLAAVLFPLALVLLASFVAKRTTSLAAFARSTAMHKLTQLNLASALAFVFVSSVFVFGIGVDGAVSRGRCEAVSTTSIALWIVTKASQYAFGVERVHLVYSRCAMSRWRTPTYRTAALVVALVIGTAVWAEIGRNGAILVDNSHCSLGLKRGPTVLLLATNILVNAALTVVFLIPVWKASFYESKRLAQKSSVATLVALTSSSAVLGALMALGGWESSVVWLGSSSADVVINSVVIYIITAPVAMASSLFTSAALAQHEFPLSPGVTKVGGPFSANLSPRSRSLPSFAGFSLGGAPNGETTVQLPRPAMSRGSTRMSMMFDKDGLGITSASLGGGGQLSPLRIELEADEDDEGPLGRCVV